MDMRRWQGEEKEAWVRGEGSDWRGACAKGHRKGRVETAKRKNYSSACADTRIHVYMYITHKGIRMLGTSKSGGIRVTLEHKP